MRTLEYQTQGTCSRQINITVNDDDVIENVEFVGGCAGNTHGLSALLKGMKAEDVIDRLKGVLCGSKGTSCPDQLAHALEQMINEKK